MARGTKVVVAVMALLWGASAWAQETAGTLLWPGVTLYQEHVRHLSFSGDDTYLACSTSTWPSLKGRGLAIFELATGEVAWSWFLPPLLPTSLGDLVFARNVTEGGLLLEGLVPPLMTRSSDRPPLMPGWPGLVQAKFPPQTLRLAVIHGVSSCDRAYVLEGDRVRPLPEAWAVGPYIHVYNGPEFEYDGALELMRPEQRRARGPQALIPRFEAMAFSPGGSVLATVDSDGYLALWSGPPRPALRHVRADGQTLGAIAYSPRGDLIATVGNSGVVRLWTGMTLKLVAELLGHAETAFAGEPGTQWLEFSPDGSRLVSFVRDGTLRVWSVEEGAQETCIDLPPELGERPRFAFAGYDDWVYAAGSTVGGTVLGVLDLISGGFTPLKKLPDTVIWAMACSPSNKLLAIADGEHGEILTWHLKPPEPAPRQ